MQTFLDGYHPPWARPNHLLEWHTYNAAFRNFLETEKRKKQCRSCRRPSWNKYVCKARGLMNKSLFCAECDSNRPLAFFSRVERIIRHRYGDRICNGREGYIRLCDHKVIHWDMVTEARHRQIEQGAGNTVVTVLTYEGPGHQPACRSLVAEGISKAKTRPTVTLDFDQTSGTIMMRIEWAGHLVLPETTPDDRLTAHDIAQQLRRLWKGVGEYIVP